jgi:hypothetical protein
MTRQGLGGEMGKCEDAGVYIDYIDRAPFAGHKAELSRSCQSF